MVIKHLFILVAIKLPLQVLGFFSILPLACLYKMGKLPRMFKWFDDYRGRLIEQGVDCDNNFGKHHCEIYQKANETAFGRYKWLAFRNAVNYFQHDVIGHKLSINVPYVAYTGHYIVLYEGSKETAREYYRYIDLGLFKLRIRIGYKIADLDHVKHMRRLGIPLQWVFSIGVRK